MTTALALAATVLCAAMLPARADRAHEDLNRDAVTKAIRPLYRAFAAKTETLRDKVDALCAQPSEDALRQVKDTYAVTVKRWSWVEIFRFADSF